MPTYEYQCKRCKHRFEAFQSITDKPLVKCPACGKRVLERLIGGGAGIIFKGSGFYVTDYKRGSPTPANSKGSPTRTDKASGNGD